MGWNRTPVSLGKHIARPCIENVTGRNRGNTGAGAAPLGAAKLCGAGVLGD